MFFPPTPVTSFEGIGEKMWWGKDGPLKTNNEDVRRRKFTSPILEVGPEKRTSMLELQQKTTKKIQSLCLLSFSYHDMLFLFAQLT